MKNFIKKIISAILTLEARLVLKKYHPKIIAVTGNVGKTSTKDMIYTLLAPSLSVRKSQKSFNSEIGIPLTILGCPNGWNNIFIWIENIFRGLGLVLFPSAYPAVLILEVGADRPGDIKTVAKWIKPDVVVMTSFGKVPVHVEYFDSPQAVIEEKGHLVKALRKSGLLIARAGEDSTAYFKSLTEAKVFTYGIDIQAEIQASHLEIVYEKIAGRRMPAGIRFRLDCSGNSVPVEMRGVLGKQHMYPVLAAFAVGISENVNLIKLADALSDHVLTPGRMRLLPGIKNTVIVDDTYNSSPLAVAEALNTLEAVTIAGRKIAILGDMMELGKYSHEEHLKVGEHASRASDFLVTVGIRARAIAEGALDGGMLDEKILQFDSSVEAATAVKSMIFKGDLILVKGSQSTRMEKIVEEIIAHPEESESLLVRQDPEWKKR